MEYASLIERKRERLAELEQLIGDPSLFQDQVRAGELMREHRRTRELLDNWEELQRLNSQIEENTTLSTGSDAELAELALAELPDLQARAAKLQEDVVLSFTARRVGRSRCAAGAASRHRRR